MGKSHVSQFNSAGFQADILGWYQTNKRDLPWRTIHGGKTDTYRIWLSEVMLQQTTVPAVIPYFLKFTATWPNITALAKAKDEDVMVVWAGLGYYARARNLLKCARMVAFELEGVFPESIEDLLTLPGVGPYTAAAIAAIAYGRQATVVDGNIERIVARLFAIDVPFPKGKQDIRVKADLIFADITGKGKKSVQTYPQALMDLGSAVCTPKSPSCNICPVAHHCRAFQNKTPDKYPVRPEKKGLPVRKGEVYLIHDKDGNVLFEKRRENRMLGGMVGLPTTDWDNKGENSYIKPENSRYVGAIHHTFTHFRLELDVFESIVPSVKNMINSDTGFISFNLACTYSGDIGLATLFLKALNILFPSLSPNSKGNTDHEN